MRKLWAQGDIIIELVTDTPSIDKKLGPATRDSAGIDPDGSAVLARGEVTGHRHRFTGDSGVTLFRDDGLARDMPAELYIGHVKIPAATSLIHEEHAAIDLPAGSYRIRRQREWSADMARVVAD